MRTFLRAHWKVLVAIILLVLLALFTVSPGAAVAEPSLALRLRSHAATIASSEQGAAQYIEGVLQGEGYAVRRQAWHAGGKRMDTIEASVARLAPNTKPARIFIVGARHEPNGSGSAAVLELARLLKDMRPSQGTEVKFVFCVDEAPSSSEGEALGSLEHDDASPVLAAIGWYSQRQSRKLPQGMAGGYPDTGYPDVGNFIAFVGTLEASRLVQDALSAFRAVSDFPGHGLAAPAYVQGVTFSDRAATKRFGYPAIMITDTGFLRYPYYQTKTKDGAEDTPDKLAYDSTARVVQGLARTIARLASGAQT